MPITVFPTVSRDRTLRVELLKALLISPHSSRPPYPLALKAEGRALASEAVALAFFAGFSVLAVRVGGTSARETSARLLKVTLVGCIATDHAAGF